jgi:hypothetical protein
LKKTWLKKKTPSSYATPVNFLGTSSQYWGWTNKNLCFQLFYVVLWGEQYLIYSGVGTWRSLRVSQVDTLGKAPNFSLNRSEGHGVNRIFWRAEI